MGKKINVSEPYLDDIEKKYIDSALKEKAISGFYGEYIGIFEREFARYCDCSYGISTTSGTTAIHLALLAISLRQDDEVLVSTLTNMATFFPVLYQGAKPIPIDIQEDTLNIDPNIIEKKITSRTKAIIVVHLFGHPVDMDPIIAIAKKYNLYIIEDCAEAHGATYKGKKVGSFGDIGCFSFYANKIITTGEGGMLTTNNHAMAERSRSIKSLAFGDKNKFMHKFIGYNYRMTNLQAAIGCGQLEKIEYIISKKRDIAKFYSENLSDIECIQLPIEKSYARNVYWMYHLVLKGIAESKRSVIMKSLIENGIETRECFIPYNMQEIFIREGLTKYDDCPKANKVAGSGFYLPTSPILTKEDQKYIVGYFKKIIKTL